MLSSLAINRSHLHLVCRSPSPLDMCPSGSKAHLLGRAHATPGVAGPWTPAEWWVLRALACLDQGLNFPLKMRKRFIARSHKSFSCSLKLLPRWLLLSWERIILSPPVPFFLFSSSSLSLASHHLRFCVDLLGDPSLALVLSLHSFPTSRSQSTTIPPFTTTAHSAFLLLPLLHPQLVFFLYLLYSSLPTHDRLCN